MRLAQTQLKEQKMTDDVERLTADFKALKIKIEKLRAFIWDGDVFEQLPRPDQALLIEQHAVMRQYSEILIIRLSRARTST